MSVLVVPEAWMAEIVGFHFHRGIMACGLRKPPWILSEVLVAPLGKNVTLVALYGVQDPENMGAILRSCAALGIEHVLIGPKSADPFSRRVLRVSMGTLLSLKIIRSTNLMTDLAWLKERHGVESVATTLAVDSKPLEQTGRQTPLVILMGNEAYGLPPELQQAADHRVRIDMRLGTDSLNVGVAAGIVLHYFSRVARKI
jgi:tRNA G18 (ribose-2'-O)-methylase SpoU